MRTTLRAMALTGLVAGALGLMAVPAKAQVYGHYNTYADVPFNQGSLFYRPSGAQSPAVTRTYNSYYVQPRRGLFRRNRVYRPTTYTYPTYNTYVRRAGRVWYQPRTWRY